MEKKRYALVKSLTSKFSGGLVVIVDTKRNITLGWLSSKMTHKQANAILKALNDTTAKRGLTA